MHRQIADSKPGRAIALAKKFALCKLAGMMTLSEYIAASGKSQAQIAEMFGLSASYLSQIASGKRLPALDVAARIEAATGGVVTAVSFASHRIAPVSAPDARGSCPSTENHSVSSSETVEFHTGGSPDAV